MRFLFGIVRWLSAMLLHLSIFFIIGATSFVFLLGSQQTVKDLLSNSEVYGSFVDSIIDANIDQANSSLSTLPLDDENVRLIINESFSPETLQEQTERMIDDVYSWLDGSVDDLSFTLDFTPSKQRMNNGIADYAANRVLSLPECAQFGGEVNVFTTDCKPVTFTYSFVQSQVLSDLQNSTFLSDPVYTELSLPEDAAGRRIYEQYAYAPTIYQLLHGSLYFSVILFVLLAIVFVYLRRPLNRGLQILGRDLLSNGVMIIILTIIFGFLLPRYTDTFGVQGAGTPALFNNVIDLYIQRLDIIVINVAIQIAALGLVLLAIVRVNKVYGGYRGARFQAGMVSSLPSRQGSGGKRSASRPPLQTSESGNRVTKSTKKARKYRKMGL